MAPVSTAASGNTSWMLNTSGARCDQATSRPVTPIVSGGDIAITASARRNQPPAPSPAHAASAEKPANPSGPAEQVALVAAGERVDAADRAPRRVASRAHRVGRSSPARWRGPGTTAGPSRRASSWPRPASSSTMRVSTRPVGAVSGSKCGPSTTSRSGVARLIVAAAPAVRRGEAGTRTPRS